MKNLMIPLALLLSTTTFASELGRAPSTRPITRPQIQSIRPNTQTAIQPQTTTKSPTPYHSSSPSNTIQVRPQLIERPRIEIPTRPQTLKPSSIISERTGGPEGPRRIESIRRPQIERPQTSQRPDNISRYPQIVDQPERQRYYVHREDYVRYPDVSKFVVNYHYHRELVPVYQYCDRYDYHRALICFDRIPVYSADIFFARAQVYFALMNYRSSCDDIYRTIRCTPRWTELRWVYNDPCEFDRHRQILIQWVRDHPEDCESHFLLGFIYYNEGNFSCAIDELNYAISLDSNHQYARLLINVIR